MIGSGILVSLAFISVSSLHTYRVAPAFGGRSTDPSKAVRVTAISCEGPVPEANWDISGQFLEKWTHMHYGTKMAPGNGL